MARIGEVGDWSIHEAQPPKDGKDCTHTVRGWGLRWYCASEEDARRAADLLDGLANVCLTVSEED